MITYADDFIVTAASEQYLKDKVIPTLTASLKEVGLELSIEKSKITKIEDGFNFLGFNVRKYPCGKLLIKPSKASIKTFLEDVRAIIKSAIALPTEILIHQLNQKITGWTNYYKGGVSSKVFAKIDFEIYSALENWCLKRHARKGKHWIFRKYFTTLAGDNWRFHCAIKDKGQQILVVSTEDEALTKHLMEEICKPANLNRAYKLVKANKGAAGIDGMTVDELYNWVAKHKESLIESMLAGTYQPKPVRGIEIPKPGKNKGTRLLGIPCVVDRLVQQSILQILEPMFDPTFSDSSYGFRPGRSAHQALKKAQEYVRAGHGIVVDVDLEKFFDRVNHDILMSKLAKRIKDKRLLKIIRCFLSTGILMHGIYTDRLEGVSQGGPLSPFLSNLMLDDLDKELERRGHKFCRYADDANIYVRSLRAGERVLLSVKQFLKNRLKLQVNDAKSGCAPVYDRQFLGYRLLSDGRLVIAPHSVKRIEDKVRAIRQRKRGVSLEQVISELNQTLRGWINYFRLTAWNSQVAELDTWIRRKVRCYRIKQRKQGRPLYNFLIKLGVPAWSAQVLVSSGKGWWRLSLSSPTNQAMSNAWFEKQGLVSLVKQRALLNI